MCVKFEFAHTSQHYFAVAWVRSAQQVEINTTPPTEQKVQQKDNVKNKQNITDTCFNGTTIYCVYVCTRHDEPLHQRGGCLCLLDDLLSSSIISCRGIIIAVPFELTPPRIYISMYTRILYVCTQTWTINYPIRPINQSSRSAKFKPHTFPPNVKKVSQRTLECRYRVFL